jgi:3',5'-cyclic AMP phosphodiesterase CpdA
MKLAWVTDIHLDFLGESEIARFCDSVTNAGPDGVLVGGDIAQAASFEAALRQMEERIGKPIWFVLGNHDFYGASVAAVRQRAATLSREGRIVWLGAVEAVELTPRTGLVGHDGWGDARLGDHEGTSVILNDFLRITDLIGTDRTQLAGVLGRLGEESAVHLRRVLPVALERFEHVVVLTHVPPFREACWHEGRISGDDYLPYFACKATGNVLLDEASRHGDRLVTVLCGHTHSSGEYRPLPNLRVITGAAQYGRPTIQWPLLEV